MKYSLTTLRGLYDRSRGSAKKLMRFAGVVSVLSLCLLAPIPNHQVAQGRETQSFSSRWANMVPDTDPAASKIVTALEIKAYNEKSIELAKVKLRTMDDKQARLLARLSERITADEKSPGSGIAFLLTAVLITLS